MTLTKVQLRIVVGVLLAIALAAVVALTRLDSGGSQANDSIIESLIPGPNDKVLQQSPVGVDLLSGWDASLLIDGRVIPDDQLTKTLELGQISFQPGPGKELEFLPPGQNCATVTYWQRATGPDQSFNRSWCFTVL